MSDRGIFITQFDKDRLLELIRVAEDFGTGRQDLRDLREELERATLVPSEDIPASVVTMNSRVVLRDVDSEQPMTVSLVFPADADASAGAISVLAPVGTAILGYSETDIVEWPVPAGMRRIRVEKVLYQPEAAGDFDL